MKSSNRVARDIVCITIDIMAPWQVLLSLAKTRSQRSNVSHIDLMNEVLSIRFIFNVPHWVSDDQMWVVVRKRTLRHFVRKITGARFPLWQPHLEEKCVNKPKRVIHSLNDEFTRSYLPVLEKEMSFTGYELNTKKRFMHYNKILRIAKVME